MHHANVKHFIHIGIVRKYISDNLQLLYKNMFLIPAYWPRGDSASAAAAAANLFAAGGFALPPHPGMPFGMLPPGAAAAAAAAAAGRYPATSSSSSSQQQQQAYNNAAAYTNTLSVAASQAASLGIPAASK